MQHAFSESHKCEKFALNFHTYFAAADFPSIHREFQHGISGRLRHPRNNRVGVPAMETAATGFPVPPEAHTEMRNGYRTGIPNGMAAEPLNPF